MSKTIKVDEVWFSYTPGSPVLRGVTITFTPGVTAIIGENGAGKTTLMKLLNGLITPSKGSVLVGELDTREHFTSQLAKYVGIVFQNPDDQIFKSKVIDEVMFGPLNIGMSMEEARRRAKAAMAELQITGIEEENPYDLSYPVRKRIAIASILAMNTEVVIFDEPTIGQDIAGVRLLGKIVTKLGAEGKTVISIVHDMNFAGQFFQRIISMAEGQVVADGKPEEVFRDWEGLKRAHVSPPSLVQLADALQLKQTPLTEEQFIKYYCQERLPKRNR